MTDTLQLEKTLWQAADKLRNNTDAAEYKHVVLGLIFLKYISDAFGEHYEHLKSIEAETGADPEDKDEYTADKIFYVPPQARWKWLQGRAKLPTIGKDIDDAMDAIEKDNPSLKGVLQCWQAYKTVRLFCLRHLQTVPRNIRIQSPKRLCLFRFRLCLERWSQSGQ